jgi:hypothetical protein
LEVVLQGLHESEIRCGIQNDPEFGSRTEKATFYGTIVGDRQVWPAADRIAAWLHETALRLFPESPYAKSHGRLSGSPVRKVASNRADQIEDIYLRRLRIVNSYSASATP